MKPATLRTTLAVLGLSVAMGCGGKGGDAPQANRAKDIGEQTADITADTGLMRQASNAANTIVRNATDCDAVKAALPETNRILDEAESKVRTQAGRTTLGALKSQVRNVVQACP